MSTDHPDPPWRVYATALADELRPFLSGYPRDVHRGHYEREYRIGCDAVVSESQLARMRKAVAVYDDAITAAAKQEEPDNA